MNIYKIIADLIIEHFDNISFGSIRTSDLEFFAKQSKSGYLYFLYPKSFSVWGIN